MKFFDSHAHLDDEKFNDDREEIIEKIHNDEIENFVSAGYSLEGSKKAVELSKNMNLFMLLVVFLQMIFHKQKMNCGKI